MRRTHPNGSNIWALSGSLGVTTDQGGTLMVVRSAGGRLSTLLRSFGVGEACRACWSLRPTSGYIGFALAPAV
jgi:hypothetical protein